jgi:imidazole glycerol-phosphate synthase subunit HisH
MRVAIVNSGIGTTASMLNMFRHIGADAEVVNDSSKLDAYSHLVLPGVGHYTEGSRRLAEGGWNEHIVEFARTGKPVLGVCLGMQLLGETSEEGPGDGLGLIPFDLIKLPSDTGLPIPHMGWNTIVGRTKPSALLELEEEPRFYFVHSFAVDADNPYALATTEYGQRFASVVGRDNVTGVQFHPEKSHRFGMALLRNFVKSA